MKTKDRSFFIGLLVFFILSAMFLTKAQAEQVALVGEVNDTYQIVGEDGQIYEVAADEIGNQVVLTLISQKVKVTGTIKEKNDVKIITILSYEVLED
jgi:hypothetical protein